MLPWTRTDFALGLLLHAGTLNCCLSHWAPSQPPATATLSELLCWDEQCVETWLRSGAAGHVQVTLGNLRAQSAAIPPGSSLRRARKERCWKELSTSRTLLCSVQKPREAHPRKTAPEAEDVLGRQARAPLLHVRARQEGEQSTLEEGAALSPESGRIFDVDYSQTNWHLPLPKRERLE